MRHLSTLLIPAMLLLCSVHSLAKVRGEVVDSLGAAIPNATVRVLDQKSRKTVESALSTYDGSFEVKAPSAGRYLIAVSATGFTEKMIDIGAMKPSTDVFRRIRLNALDCDAPSVNCDTFDGRYEDPNPVIAHGQLIVNSSDAVDLENGKPVPLASGTADFSLTESKGGLYLTPLNKAEFSRGCGKDFSDSGTQTKKLPLRIDGFSGSSQICIKTNRARYARVFVTRDVKPGDKHITLYLVTRAR